MPTVIVRSLKASKPQQLNFLQSYKVGLQHVINLRPVWCQELVVSQECTAPRRKVGVSLVSFSLWPPPPNGKKATTHFFSLDDRLIPPTEYPSLFKMEEGKGKFSIEVNQKKGAEDAKVQEEKTVRLQKEQEKREEEKRKEEAERNRVKEQEIEDKIGPPPEKPLAGDCCGQGCEVCVWDTYWEELDEYKTLRKAAEEESG